MELVVLHKRVMGLDIHQAQVTTCALIEEADGTTRIEHKALGVRFSFLNVGAVLLPMTQNREIR